MQLFNKYINNGKILVIIVIGNNYIFRNHVYHKVNPSSENLGLRFSSCVWLILLHTCNNLLHDKLHFLSSPLEPPGDNVLKLLQLKTVIQNHLYVNCTVI